MCRCVHLVFKHLKDELIERASRIKRRPIYCLEAGIRIATNEFTDLDAPRPVACAVEGRPLAAGTALGCGGVMGESRSCACGGVGHEWVRTGKVARRVRVGAMGGEQVVRLLDDSSVR